MGISKKMIKQDLFTHLPPKLITEILSRVPAHAILSCKCVCKLWCDLVSTHEFVMLHLSKAVPGLALIVETDSTEKLIEHTHDHHFSTITKLNFEHLDCATIQGSVDGLLLLRTWEYASYGSFELHLCNPITLECIDLLHSHSRPFDTAKLGSTFYGFGVSKISGQYKAVGIYAGHTISECKVYTIGAGSWRSVAHHTQVTYIIRDGGQFVNGSLHWLGLKSNGTPCISCFDLETELFTTFSLPPSLQNKTKAVLLFALGNSLSLCDYTSNGDTVMWSMKVDKTWTKEFVIGAIPGLRWIYPLKIFENGVILMTRGSNSLFYYSIKNKTTQSICNGTECVYMTSRSHTPSLLSLKCFRMENTIPF